MINTNVRIRGTRREMRKHIRDLPEILSGKKPDISGIGKLFKANFAYYWFEKVHEAFLIKSTGGVDDLGVSWPRNSPSTIAQRGIRPADMRKIRGKGKSAIEDRTRGLLTPAQDALWRGIFKSTYLRLVNKVGVAEAKATAARIAWAILKSRGAQTKLEVLGKRVLPIGRDTDRLIRACEPGRVSGSSYQPPADQQVSFHYGSLDFKIKVPYAKYFHKKRKIWPADYRSGPWVKYAARKALEEVVKAMSQGKGLR